MATKYVFKCPRCRRTYRRKYPCGEYHRCKNGPVTKLRFTGDSISVEESTNV